MGLKVIFLYSLVCYLFFNCKWVEGSRKLSKEKDLEIVKQLKRLNKPAVKTIKTKYGDIYDCVDFFKQPSFDNPLLKDHNFHPETKPTSIPRRVHSESEVKNVNYKNININLENGGCPNGTVPIRRTTKDDLIRTKFYSKMHASKIKPLTKAAPGVHFALAQTKENINYGGVGSFMTIWNILTVAPQYTSGRIKAKSDFESIEAGYTVNPIEYGDNLTRLYIYTKGLLGGFCFNAKCGFVQTSTKIPVDIVLTPTSVYGDPDYYGITLSIHQDPVEKNWFLSWDTNNQIGFWPQTLFVNLSVSATQVEWGGEIFSPPDQPAPGMGAGEPLFADTIPDAEFKQSNIVVDNKIIDPPSDLWTCADAPTYGVSNEGNRGADRYVITYGGVPGYIGN